MECKRILEHGMRLTDGLQQSCDGDDGEKPHDADIEEIERESLAEALTVGRYLARSWPPDGALVLVGNGVSQRRASRIGTLTLAIMGLWACGLVGSSVHGSFTPGVACSGSPVSGAILYLYLKKGSGLSLTWLSTVRW